MFKDKNTIFGFLLIFVIIIVFSIYNSPSKEDIAKDKLRKDSLENVKVQQQKDLSAQNSVKDSIPVLSSEKLTQNQTQQIITDTVTLEKYPFLSAETISLDSVYHIDNGLYQIGISTIGGKIKELKFNEQNFLKWDKTPLMLIDSTLRKFGLTFMAGNRPVNTNGLQFYPQFYGNVSENSKIVLNQEKPEVKFGMRLYPFPVTDGSLNNDSWVEYIYTFNYDEYKFGFTIQLHNPKKYFSENTTFINLETQLDLIGQEKSVETEKNVSTIYYRFFNDDVKHLSERKNDKEQLKTKVQWVSFKQQFFSMALISKEGFQSADIETKADTSLKHKDYLKTMSSVLTIPVEMKENIDIPISIYAGPNKYNIMRHYQIELERQIPLGWSFFLLAWINRYAVIPVFNFLEGFNMNYGIIILILTILLKIVLFPIAYKTYLSSARMKVLKPEIDEIGKKFPKKEDAMKKQQATMELYRKAGVNPMSGCLPMLLQFPILIAMFRFFPASIELRQQAFLWAKDLSSYDSILDLSFNIPFYGSHVSLFTLLMTITTLIYTKMNSKMMSSSNQLPGMNTMMYLMPIMFLGFFNSYSSALSYYYFLTNMITFGQMWAFRKIINEQKVIDKIQENKSKKSKKSGFQRRLEEMAKQQQQRAKRK